MKLTFGRKFWSAIIGIIILSCAYFITLIKQGVESTVTIMFMTYIVMIVFMYIGGNIWKSFIKSKYFKSEMSESIHE